MRFTRTNIHFDGQKPQTIIEECHVFWDSKTACFRYRAKVDCGAVVGLLIFDDDRAESVETEVIGNIFEQ